MILAEKFAEADWNAVKAHERNDGIRQGMQQGMQQGMEKGEGLLASLIQKMITAGESDKIGAVTADAGLRKEYYRKYGIQNTVAL